MKKVFLSMLVLLSSITSSVQAKDLIVYFSAEGHTQAVAEKIAELMNADVLRIEAADPYASNPYDDSNRIQNEAYNDLRPEVANLMGAEVLEQYDRLFIGSPCWWHQPAMVVCTFLEAYDLTGKTIIPFFTYGATTYLNESMQKIYKVTPKSLHIPSTLPEDLDAEDITRPGRPDDDGIDMPGNAINTEAWLKRLGLLNTETAINAINADDENFINIQKDGNMIQINLLGELSDSSVNVFNVCGAHTKLFENNNQYQFIGSKGDVYLISVRNEEQHKHYTKKVIL